MARKSFKFGVLDPIKLKDYGFGLFLFKDQLCFKADRGGVFVVNSGEKFEEAFGVNQNIEVIPLEY